MSRRNDYAWHRQVSHDRFVPQAGRIPMRVRIRKLPPKPTFAQLLLGKLLFALAILCGGLLAIHDLMTLAGVQSNG